MNIYQHLQSKYYILLEEESVKIDLNEILKEKIPYK